MIIDSINLPKWVVMEVSKMYPNVSSQTAIKKYLVLQLNSRGIDVHNQHNKIRSKEIESNN